MNDDPPEYESRHPTPPLYQEVHWIGLGIALGIIFLMVKGCGA